MRKPPKRIFRDRRPAPEQRDLRREELGRGSIVDAPDLSSVIDPTKHLVYLPAHRFVELATWECIEGLRDLNFEVWVNKGSAIDQSRSLMASEAILHGFESILFVDGDMRFDPADAVKLFLHPEHVVAGVYAQKVLGPGGRLCVDLMPGVDEIPFGACTGGRLQPVRKVGAGFLRIKTDFLRRMAKTLDLPWCRIQNGVGWPFFLPMIVEEDGGAKYLGEDYSFCYRCCAMGEPPFVDTSFVPWHIGDYAFGLEEAEGKYPERRINKIITIDRPPCGPIPPPQF